MLFWSAILSVFLVLPPFQSPADSFRKHYETAEAQRRAGNFPAAEAEFSAILAEAYHELGKVYTTQENYKPAVTALEAAAAYRPDAPDVLVDLAIAYFRADQYKKALDPLNKVVARAPRNVAAHHMLGKTYFMLGDLPKSVAELKTALRLSPDDYDVEYTLSLAYLRQKQLPLAKQIFTRMIARIGDRAPLRILIGRAYRETGYLEEGILEFKKAVELDPKYPRVHYYLGLTYLLKEGAARLADAEAEFKIELATHPDDYFANYYLGILSNMARTWDVSIGYLEKASRLSPEDPDPYFHLGQAYQGAEKHEQAIEALKKSIALNPDLSHNDYQVATAHYRLGQSLLRLGRNDEAEGELKLAADLKSRSLKIDQQKTEDYLNDVSIEERQRRLTDSSVAEQTAAPVELDPQLAEALRGQASYLTKVVAAAHNAIGLLRAERQDFGAAAEQFARAATWNPQQEGLSYNLGLANFKAERYREAVPALESELKIHPDNVQAKRLLGISYFATDDFEKAAATLSDVVVVATGDVATYYPLALSLAKLGRTEESNRIVERMVASGDQSPQVHILLGQAHAARGETEKAVEELRAALGIDPKVRLAHFYIGLAYLKSGKSAEAAREFESELLVSPGDMTTKYHLGFAQLSARDTARGIQTLQEVVKARPDFADARYELGKALLERGDVANAIANLEAAVKLDPEKAHVHYQLGRAYITAGRQADGDKQLEISKQLKAKERNEATP